MGINDIVTKLGYLWIGGLYYAYGQVRDVVQIPVSVGMGIAADAALKKDLPVAAQVIASHAPNAAYRAICRALADYYNKATGVPSSAGAYFESEASKPR